jgi:hypothetical protein
VARSTAPTPDQYLAELAPERAAELCVVRDAINAALKPGFVERMAWGVISWEVPLETSGPTYNKQPLLYVGLGAQKNYNALYMNCAYCSAESTARLQTALAAVGKTIEPGKACIRFRSAADLPLETIVSEIASSTPEDYVIRHRTARQR